MNLRRNVVAVALLSLATIGILGPHLLMLGFKAAGARPPAALVYFCPLHNAAAGKAPVVALDGARFAVHH